MPDTTLSSLRAATLAPVVTSVLQLTPSPLPKGRYALARWGIALEGPAAAYAKQMGALVESVAAPGSIKALPAGGISFDFKDDDARQFYASESLRINDEAVTLSGVRQITHVELAGCPITGEQEKVLMQFGVLDDVEPA